MAERRKRTQWDDGDEELTSRGGFIVVATVVVFWFLAGLLLPRGSELGRAHAAFLVQGLWLFPSVALTLYAFIARSSQDAMVGATFVLTAPLLWMFDRPMPDLVPHMLPLVIVPLGLISIVGGLAEKEEEHGRRLVQGGLSVIALGVGLYALLHAVDRFFFDVDGAMAWLINVLPEE